MYKLHLKLSQASSSQVAVLGLLEVVCGKAMEMTLFKRGSHKSVVSTPFSSDNRKPIGKHNSKRHCFQTVGRLQGEEDV